MYSTMEKLLMVHTEEEFTAFARHMIKITYA